ncbi:MAG: B12-binding domain-containing radical SAM protein [Desulfuromonas sp.]|nr:MAG: B12-binding domain-containing radical SAM protein [Desulfuromonas sp.]
MTSPWLSGVLRPRPGGGILWETARGCIYGCAYCFDARGTHGVRHLPEERLIEELKLFANAGASQVWILDSTFNAPPERGKRLLRLLLEHAPQLHFHLEARAELLDAETVELLSQLPCSVQLGLQTTSEAALRNLRRSFDRDQFDHVCRLLNQYGVTFGIDLIYALPGDSHAGFIASLDYALAQRPNQLDVFPLSVLPGTELHRRRKELKIFAPQQPPYVVEKLPNYTPRDIRRSRELAQACDLFYNRGRAVGFFSSLAEVCALSGSALLEAFDTWLRTCSPSAAQEDAPEKLLQLQLDFTHHQLTTCGQGHLSAALSDLVRFHYHYAEALLGAETPAAQQPLPEDLSKAVLRCAPSLRLVDFHYEIQDLLDMEASGLDLEAFVDLFRPVGSTALFFRREGEVACESLSDEFSLLLLNCREANRVEHLVDESFGRDVMIELLTLAWEEGLLEIATAGEAGP